jgi:hypothetical protein
LARGSGGDASVPAFENPCETGALCLTLEKLA